jgi:hypothetical protein
MKTIATQLLMLLALLGSVNAFAQGGGNTGNQTNPQNPPIPDDRRTVPIEELSRNKKNDVTKPEVCGRKDRVFDHRELTPWKKKKVAVRDMSLSKPTRPAGFVDITWVREVKTIYTATTCELVKGHPGAHKGKAVKETEVKVVEETIRYAEGESQDPPKDHWTDKLPL